MSTRYYQDRATITDKSVVDKEDQTRPPSPFGIFTQALTEEPFLLLSSPLSYNQLPANYIGGPVDLDFVATPPLDPSTRGSFWIVGLAILQAAPFAIRLTYLGNYSKAEAVKETLQCTRWACPRGYAAMV